MSRIGMQHGRDRDGSAYGEVLAKIQAEAFDELASAAAPSIVSHLRALPLPVEHVVDIGCGAGTTTAALLAAGFSVTAIEPSAALRRIAQRRAKRARVIAGSAYDQPLPSWATDLGFSVHTATAYGVQPLALRRCAFFATAV